MQLPPQKKDLAPEEIATLYEEPLDTDNAMVAVLGYNPTDDARLCKHYDARTGSCYKGTNCKFIHKAKDADGWTKDRKPASIDIWNKVEVPPVGEALLLEPTHIVSTNMFYAHIFQDDKAKRKAQSDLYQFQFVLNEPHNIAKYRKYEGNVVPCELPTCSSQYAKI